MVVTKVYDNMWYAWKQLHLFRYVISYQQAKYIVDNYKGRTDEEKLINYIVKEKIWNWTADESARLHQKLYTNSQNTIIYPNGHSNANGGVNLKVVTNTRFRSEFIIIGDGKFLALLDKDATQDAKANCSSFNYARRNDFVHKVLDVYPTSNNEPKFRDESKVVMCNGEKIKDQKGNKVLYESPSELNQETKELVKKHRKQFIERFKDAKNK